MIYNLTDAFFIGKLNDTIAMAAISLAVPYTTVQMALGNLFGVGGGTYIARQMGRKDTDSAKKASATVFFFAVLAGVICCLVSVLCNVQILGILGTNDSTYGMTFEYLLPYMVGSPVMIVNFMMEELVHSEGASTRAMTGSMISVVTNLVLDPILIFVFQMGIQGAAVATVLGNVCAFGYYIWYVTSQSKALAMAPKKICLDRNMILEILKIGSSAMLLDLFLIISGLMFNRYSVHYGEYVVAGFSISQRLVMVADMIGMGIYMGVVPLVAAAYSSNDEKRLNTLLKKTAIYLFGMVCVVGSVVFLFRASFVRIFTQDQLVEKTAALILTVQLASTLFAAGSGLFTCIFQAFGKGVPSLIMSVARGMILIPIIILLNRWYGLNGVIVSLLISEMCACLIGLGMYLVVRRTQTTAPKLAYE